MQKCKISLPMPTVFKISLLVQWKDPLKDIVRDEVTQSIDHAMEANFEDLLLEKFDIHSYSDEINYLALEDFDINNYSNDLDISPDETETKDLIRDVLRGATFKMEV